VNEHSTIRSIDVHNNHGAPPAHMIKLTETREITPYLWMHPDEEL
jgi:hypothetical protein